MSTIAEWRRAQQPWGHLSDALGGWISGFVDGEGCFVIAPRKRGFICSFTVKLRADDWRVLERLQELLKMGRLYDVPRVSPTRHPQIYFRVESKAGCLNLVDLFEAFPLQSKKARDFELWREAVIFWSTVGGGRTDWSEMRRLYEELRATREFRSRSVVSA